MVSFSLNVLFPGTNLSNSFPTLYNLLNEAPAYPNTKKQTNKTAMAIPFIFLPSLV